MNSTKTLELALSVYHKESIYSLVSSIVCSIVYIYIYISNYRCSIDYKIY